MYVYRARVIIHATKHVTSVICQLFNVIEIYVVATVSLNVA